MLAALPADLEGSARAAGALVRRRKVRCAADLLRLVLVYALGDLSLRLVAAWAAAGGVADLSDAALLGRLRGCTSWLRPLVTDALTTGGVAPPTGTAGRRLRLIDGSAISGPGSQGTDWRVHLAYDPVAQRLATVELTDAHGGESLVRYAFTPGDIGVADRGYCRAPGLAHVLDQGADLVVRLNTGCLPLSPTAAAAAPLDLGAWLASAPPAEPSERPVWIAAPAPADRPPRRLPLRLIARRLAPAAADAARRRLRQQAKKHGHTPTALSRQAAGFVLLLTALEAADWPAPDVLALYRFRWQIELVFKRWKGLLGLDHLPTRDPALAQGCVLARLLVALLLDDWTAALAPLDAADAVGAARPRSLWRCCAIALLQARHAILGPLPRTAWAAALPRLGRYLCDAPRQRPNQAQAAREFRPLRHATHRVAA